MKIILKPVEGENEESFLGELRKVFERAEKEGNEPALGFLFEIVKTICRFFC